MINQEFGQALQGKMNGKGKIAPLDKGNPKQRWVHTSAKEFINMGTGIPLTIGYGAGKVWNFVEDNKIEEIFRGGSLGAKSDFDLTVSRYPSSPSFQWHKIMYNGANFIIRSELDNRVMTIVADDKIRMYPAQDSNENQLWQMVEKSSGFEFVNVGTGLPLKIGDVAVWKFDEEKKHLEDAEGSGKVLRRGKKQEDGAGVGAISTDHDSFINEPERFTFDIELTK